MRERCRRPARGCTGGGAAGSGIKGFSCLGVDRRANFPVVLPGARLRQRDGIGRPAGGRGAGAGAAVPRHRCGPPVSSGDHHRGQGGPGRLSLDRHARRALSARWPALPAFPARGAESRFPFQQPDSRAAGRQPRAAVDQHHQRRAERAGSGELDVPQLETRARRSGEHRSRRRFRAGGSAGRAAVGGHPGRTGPVRPGQRALSADGAGHGRGIRRGPAQRPRRESLGGHARTGPVPPARRWLGIRSDPSGGGAGDAGRIFPGAGCAGHALGRYPRGAVPGGCGRAAAGAPGACAGGTGGGARQRDRPPARARRQPVDRHLRRGAVPMDSAGSLAAARSARAGRAGCAAHRRGRDGVRTQRHVLRRHLRRGNVPQLPAPVRPARLVGGQPAAGRAFQPGCLRPCAGWRTGGGACDAARRQFRRRHRRDRPARRADRARRTARGCARGRRKRRHHRAFAGARRIDLGDDQRRRVPLESRGRRTARLPQRAGGRRGAGLQLCAPAGSRWPDMDRQRGRRAVPAPRAGGWFPQVPARPRRSAVAAR